MQSNSPDNSKNADSAQLQELRNSFNNYIEKQQDRILNTNCSDSKKELEYLIKICQDYSRLPDDVLGKKQTYIKLYNILKILSPPQQDNS